MVGREARPVGFEPTTFGFEVRCKDSATASEANGLRLPPDPVGLPLAIDVRQSEPLDTDLAVIVDAWPSLPDAVKAGILAMVRACNK